MTDLSDLYSARIMELAAQLPKAKHLDEVDATATQHSRLCGSTIAVELKLRDGRVVDYGQTVKACLLGQAAASVVAREIIGATPEELRTVGVEMRDMLKRGGDGPKGRWADLAVLEPVRNVKARHASTLLVFDAVDQALETMAQKATARAGAAAP